MAEEKMTWMVYDMVYGLWFMVYGNYELHNIKDCQKVT